MRVLIGLIVVHILNVEESGPFRIESEVIQVFAVTGVALVLVAAVWFLKQ